MLSDELDTPVYLASSADAEGRTGLYFANRQPKRSNRASYDTAASARLWRMSSDLVGLVAVSEVANA